MNGTSHAARGNASSRLESLLRGLTDRVRRLEQQRVAPRKIGPWMFSADGDGNLIAIHDNGERRTVASLQEGK